MQKQEDKNRRILPDLHEVVHMVAHCHEQIKKQLAAHLHLHLHGSTSLKSPASADDESQVMSAQSRLRVRRVVIRIPSRSQDHVGRNAHLKALLSESNALQAFQAVLLSDAVDNRITEHKISYSRVEERCLARPAAPVVSVILCVLEVPRVLTLAVEQTWIVVTLVQILQNAGKDLRLPNEFVSFVPVNRSRTGSLVW